jgi:hypothetical protein
VPMLRAVDSIETIRELSTLMDCSNDVAFLVFADRSFSSLRVLLRGNLQHGSLVLGLALSYLLKRVNELQRNSQQTRN